jgi:hypothetical protein
MRMGPNEITSFVAVYLSCALSSLPTEDWKIRRVRKCIYPATEGTFIYKDFKNQLTVAENGLRSLN